MFLLSAYERVISYADIFFFSTNTHKKTKFFILNFSISKKISIFVIQNFEP